MKKNSALTIIAIIGAVILVLGILIGIVGFALGGTFHWSNLNRDATGWHWSWGNWDSPSGGNSTWNNLTDYSATFGDEAVTALDLDLYAGKMEIVVAEQGGYDIRNYPDGALDISFSGGKLTIKDRYHYNNLTGNPYNNTTITIYVTQNALDSLEVEFGVGQFIFSDCTVGEYKQSIGVAESSLTNITAQNCKIEGGVGDMTFRGCALNNADISAGVGALNFEGTLTGQCSVKGGIGSIRMTLTGTMNDHYFMCEQGLGEIRIGDNHVGGIGSGDFSLGNAGSANRIEIESGIGEINISFM